MHAPVKQIDTAMIKGTWCSGITSASHAEGPGFKSQCVHLCRARGPGARPRVCPSGWQDEAVPPRQHSFRHSGCAGRIFAITYFARERAKLFPGGARISSSCQRAHKLVLPLGRPQALGSAPRAISFGFQSLNPYVSNTYL